MSSESANIADDSQDNGEDFEIIAEGLASTVSKTWASVDNAEPQLVAVKTSTTIRKWAKEPHDITKECRILQRLSHPNIILVFDSLLDRSQNTMNIWMPFIPYSLSTLLDSGYFVPRFNPSKFLLLTRSLMTQILLAVAYLHAQNIAHRDLKPANVLLSHTGRVVLIDFGIAWDGTEDEKMGDLWPEQKDKMYFEVSTGPYRAPELLFGTRSYDAYAIDLWSLGAIFAEFFTQLSPLSSSPTYPSFISSPFTSDSKSSTVWDPGARYIRESLFDASRGEIGLAWSIFKILGTPREPNDEEEATKSWAWSGFRDLPDAQKVDFIKVDGIELDVTVFPNLPNEGDSAASSSVDLVRSLLRYPPEQRMKAKDVSGHVFFSSFSVLIPEDLDLDGMRFVELDGHRTTLGELLMETLGESAGR